jgi:hypothetical protein
VNDDESEMHPFMAMQFICLIAGSPSHPQFAEAKAWLKEYERRIVALADEPHPFFKAFFTPSGEPR